MHQSGRPKHERPELDSPDVGVYGIQMRLLNGNISVLQLKYQIGLFSLEKERSLYTTELLFQISYCQSTADCL